MKTNPTPTNLQREKSPTETVSDCCGAKVSSRNVFIDPPIKIPRLIDIEYVCNSCHKVCNTKVKPTVEERTI